MKRLHVHVSVKDVPISIRFYRELFNAEPVVTKPDYAKWMLDDPRVNFAISQRNRPTGVDHLGIQVEDRAELADVHERLMRAEGPVIDEGATTCCYANSEKSWIHDPALSGKRSSRPVRAQSTARMSSRRKQPNP